MNAVVLVFGAVLVAVMLWPLVDLAWRGWRLGARLNELLVLVAFLAALVGIVIASSVAIPAFDDSRPAVSP